MSNQENPEKIEIVGMYAKLYFQCIMFLEKYIYVNLYV